MEKTTKNIAEIKMVSGALGLLLQQSGIARKKAYWLGRNWEWLQKPINEWNKRTQALAEPFRDPATGEIVPTRRKELVDLIQKEGAEFNREFEYEIVDLDPGLEKALEGIPASAILALEFMTKEPSGLALPETGVHLIKH